MKTPFIRICCVQTVKQRFHMILLLLPALHHGYAIDVQLLLPVQCTTSASPESLNQLRIEDKRDVESSNSSDKECFDFESNNDHDDDNNVSDNNDED